MDLTLTTPALLFPAISLLLLAYTNRFLALAALIRSLHAKYQEERSKKILDQIDSLRWRVRLIQSMQALGVLSLLFCVVCMFVLFAGWIAIGKMIFGLSLILLILSLGFSVWEIRISVHALEMQLQDLEDARKR